jgi:hypothetical protein
MVALDRSIVATTRLLSLAGFERNGDVTPTMVPGEQNAQAVRRRALQRIIHSAVLALGQSAWLVLPEALQRAVQHSGAAVAHTERQLGPRL